MAIEEKLNEVIERHLDEMANYGIASGEMDRAIKNVVQLHNMKVEEEKLSIEKDENSIRHNSEMQKMSYDQLSSEDEQKEKKRERRFRMGLDIAGIAAPLVVYTALALLGFAREFDGCVTSDTLKRVINGVKPK